MYVCMHVWGGYLYVCVGDLSRFGNKPTPAACKLATYLLKYVSGTVDKCIKFSGSKFDMHVFSDAD
jgi:hypothetical protein